MQISSDDDDVPEIQLQWLAETGYTRQVELYASYTNQELLEVLRHEFENNPPASHLPPVRFPTEGVDVRGLISGA